MKAGVINKALGTGGSLDVSFNSQMNFLTDPAPGADPFSFKNSLEVQYIQPLLNNAFWEAKKYALAERDLEYAMTVLLIEESQKQLLLQTADLFITWVYLAEVGDLSGERVRIAGELLTRVKKMHAANLVDALDVLRSEDSLRAAELAYAQSSIRLQAVVRQLELTTRLARLGKPHGNVRGTEKQTGFVEQVLEGAESRRPGGALKIIRHPERLGQVDPGAFQMGGAAGAQQGEEEQGVRRVAEHHEALVQGPAVGLERGLVRYNRVGVVSLKRAFPGPEEKRPVFRSGQRFVFAETSRDQEVRARQKGEKARPVLSRLTKPAEKRACLSGVFQPARGIFHDGAHDGRQTFFSDPLKQRLVERRVEDIGQVGFL